MAVSRTVLSDLQVDTLREVANIGAGNALTALNTMTGAKVTMSVPNVGVMALTDFSAIAGGPEAIAAAVYMPVGGNVPGHVSFAFPYRSACELAGLLLGQPDGEATFLGEMERSAFMEAGNILLSSLLNAISEMTGLDLPVAPPGIAIDMTAAILDTILTTTPSLGGQALTIRMSLFGRTHPIEGIFIYIPETESLPVLFRALGMEC